MKTRKNLDLHDPQTYFSIFRTVSDVVKVGFWFRKRWKATNEWTRWITRVTLAGFLSGLPGLGVALAGTFLLFQLHVPMIDQYGATTGEYLSLYLGSMILWLPTSRKVNGWLGRHVDLEVPVYICVTKNCCGNLLYHEVENVGRVCPYCKGEVRLLSPTEKRRSHRWR
jgi:hypothetical protein